MRMGCTQRHRSWSPAGEPSISAKVNRVIGRADDETMLTVTRALALFLGLA